jgi:hypothetical protein
MTNLELTTFFARLFPHGFARDDVIQEIAPEHWKNSPLLACFHPSPAQVLEEQLQRLRGIEEIFPAGCKRDSTQSGRPPRPKPTMEELLAQWKERPIDVAEEVTELVGMCLWDVFSDNQEVIASDGRVVDIGSFRGASTFLDEYLGSPKGKWNCGDE